jgi:hypothetical protein
VGGASPAALETSPAAPRAGKNFGRWWPKIFRELSRYFLFLRIFREIFLGEYFQKQIYIFSPGLKKTILHFHQEIAI